MSDISGSRATACIQACCKVAGNSTATTSGRSRRIAWRTSIANSSRPGATGKYVKRPRFRLPGSGSGRSISPGIAQRFLSQDLHHRDLERLLLVSPLRGEAFQLDGVSRDVDAVARRVALVGRVRHLQKVRDVLKNSLLR